MLLRGRQEERCMYTLRTERHEAEVYLYLLYFSHFHEKSKVFVQEMNPFISIGRSLRDLPYFLALFRDLSASVCMELNNGASVRVNPITCGPNPLGLIGRTPSISHARGKVPRV